MRFGMAVGATAVAVAISGMTLAARQQPPQGQAQGAGQGRGGGRGASTPPDARGECPKGMTLVRVGSCQTPEFPPPSIVDYRPKSTLVTSAHVVPNAKFPVVDIHSHTGPNAQTIDKLIGEMDTLNIRVLNNLSGGFGDQITQKLAYIKSTKYADRFTVFANGLSGFNNVEPGFGAKAAAQLEADVKAGAIGLKIFKQTGKDTLKKDGTRLKINDPELDAFWDMAGKMNIPVIIHTAEPPQFFEPADMHNERWLELALFPDRRNFGPGQVDFKTLIAERNDLFKKHPKTRFIAAHFAWCAQDLAQCSALLDQNPNVTLEVAAVLYDFGRQPRASHDFFVKYQDRVLFGKDTYAPVEYPSYWRVFETKDEYFDYYRDYHAFWKLYGMDLPDVVLKKMYYLNALKVTPGLPQTGWPK